MVKLSEIMIQDENAIPMRMMLSMLNNKYYKSEEQILMKVFNEICARQQGINIVNLSINLNTVYHIALLMFGIFGKDDLSDEPLEQLGYLTEAQFLLSTFLSSLKPLCSQH